MALGEWLTGLSPGGSGSNLGVGAGLSDSPAIVHATHDMSSPCFSPGIFSPTKSIAMAGPSDGHGAPTAFSPSLFSPATSRLLKKRHNLLSPAGDHGAL